MSKVVGHNRNMRTGGYSSRVITDKNEYYLVDTSYTWDHGWESMAFRCDEDGNVESWEDYACERYNDYDSAVAGHKKMCLNLEDYLYGGEDDDEGTDES